MTVYSKIFTNRLILFFEGNNELQEYLRFSKKEKYNYDNKKTIMTLREKAYKVTHE